MVTTTWSQTAGMTSETGTDNIEDYAEQAEASKDAAAASETAAASSASAASTSASSASTDAASALSSKNAAATSETNASTSETNAASSSATASTAATNASTSASNSASSATASANSASAAATSETNAATSETNAAASETAAAGSATSASTSETNAATSETNAAASEAAAATSETNAATSETNAATSETNAATSETNAATSETNAASSATAAASSASAASTSATSASNAQTAAEAARDATLTAYDNFDDRYLGAKSSTPTVDNDGNALVAGSLYFDTVSGSMKVYTGSAWVAAYVSGTDYLPFSGGTMTGDVAHGDNVKANFGASADLQIYHTGGSSYIEDAGTGNLILKTNGADIRMIDGSSNELLSAVNGGRVKLGYGSLGGKLETTSTGIDVTGNATFADNGKATFGTSSDLQIYHTGSTSYIYEQGTGDLRIRGNEVRIEDGDGSTIALFQNNAGAQLRYNGTSKLETTSSGITAYSEALLDPLGNAGGDRIGLDVVETGNNTTNMNVVRNFSYDTSNQNLLTFYNNADVGFYNVAGGTQKMLWDASDEALEFGDNVKATFGASADLEVFHDGINSWINETGTGNLIIGGGNEVRITSPSAGEFMATFNNNGPVNLYYDNSKKFETTANGISVTGSVELNGWTITESGGSLYFATGGTNKMKLDASGNLDVVGSVNSNATIS